MKAGVACFHYHDVARARARLLPAIAELETRGLLAQVEIAALVLHRATFTLTDDAALIEQAGKALVRFIEASENVVDLAASRALALGQLAEATFGTRNRAENQHLVDAARRGAAGTGDEVHTLVEFAAGLTEFSELELDTTLASFRRSAHHAAAARDPWYEAAGLGRITFATILSGAFHKARPALGHARELQHSLRLWSELSLTEALSAAVDLLAGNTDGAIVRQRRRHFATTSGPATASRRHWPSRPSPPRSSNAAMLEVCTTPSNDGGRHHPPGVGSSRS